MGALSFQHHFLVVASMLIAVASLNSPTQAFAQETNFADVYLEHGLDFARTGQLDRAESELRQATKLAPGNPEVWKTLGTVLAMQKKLGESSEAFRKALKIDSSDLTSRRY